MKINLLIIIITLLLIQGCKKENAVEPSAPATVEKDFWEFKSQPDKIIRNIKMCSNGYMVAESPWNILLSKDNGETWDIILSTFTKGPIGIGPNDEIYVAGGSCIWYSYDYGNSWHEREISYMYPDSTTKLDTEIWSIATDKEGIVYLGTTSGVFRSDDRGNSWKRIINGMGFQYIRTIFVSSSNKIFAEANSNINGIFTSTDKGEHWQDNNMSSMDGLNMANNKRSASK